MSKILIFNQNSSKFAEEINARIKIIRQTSLINSFNKRKKILLLWVRKLWGEKKKNWVHGSTKIFELSKKKKKIVISHSIKLSNFESKRNSSITIFVIAIRVGKKMSYRNWLKRMTENFDFLESLNNFLFFLFRIDFIKMHK